MNVRFFDTPGWAPPAPGIAFRWVALLAAVLALAAAAPSPAAARGGGRSEVRAAGTCGKGASSSIRLRHDSGAIEIEFEVEHPRSNAPWSVTVVREGRIAWRGGARSRSNRFSLTRRMADLGGADHVMARGVGPRGVTCVAAATLPG
jgi:hypothetical protein